MLISFGEWRPDVSDFQGTTTQTVLNVFPRGDGYGPVKALQQFSQALPAACRGAFYARKTDGTIVVFAGTSDRLYKLNNSDLSWTPVTRIAALTSISNATPAVFTLVNHGLSNGNTLVLSTTGALPTGLTVGTVYYVINKAADTFNVATTLGGTAINTSSAGSGTHSMTFYYPTMPTADNWQFAQFGDTVLATQANIVPQAFNISSSAAFADLSGAPPQARYIAVVGRFIVLSGLTSNPNRVQWSDLDGITIWTAGVGFSNYVDLPDGGVVRGVGGGEFGLILQETVARQMTYVPGAFPAFQIERIGEELGLYAPSSLIRAGSRMFFYSTRGFQEYAGAGQFVPIGKERVDRTFYADLDKSSLNLMIGAPDPANTRVLWTYKSISGLSSLFDKVIAYDYVLDRWSILQTSGEFIASMTKPGLTLEGLDSISGSIDALTFSLDDVATAVISSLSAFDSSHRLGFFAGDSLEATLETPEQALGGTQRIFISGVRPITDCNGVVASIKSRASQWATAAESVETSMNDAMCPARVDTRYARTKLRFPAAQPWTYCSGVEPVFVPSGQK